MKKTKWDFNDENTIAEFNGKHSYLSNFYELPFIWRDKMFMNSEAAFQSEKTLDELERAKFCKMTAKEAKSAGRKLALRSDWEEVKDSIMEHIVYEKFAQNDFILYKLLKTGDKTLVEGNSWHDTCWGVDLSSGEGENRLGLILMRVRDRLRKELEAKAEAYAEAQVS